MKTKYLAVIILFASLTFAAFPSPMGYVNDFANILTDTVTLENELEMYEKNTTVEISVVTIDELPPEHTLATYAVDMFNEWKIGKKGEDNGILIIFVENGTRGNRMRIELGYGIQGYITGAEAGRMLDRALPLYEIGDYQTAVEGILIDISDELENYESGKPIEREDVEEVISLFIIILSNAPFVIFALIFLISAIMSNRCPYCLRGKLNCKGEYCVCKRCGKKVTRKKRYAPILVGGGYGGSSSGGGFGGFGGGSSGGGGAGR